MPDKEKLYHDLASTSCLLDNNQTKGKTTMEEKPKTAPAVGKRRRNILGKDAKRHFIRVMLTQELFEDVDDVARSRGLALSRFVFNLLKSACVYERSMGGVPDVRQ